MTLQPTSTADVATIDDGKAVVYFDGLCGFCNGAVNFLLNRDPNGKLLYAPLQGETAKRFLPPENIADLNSMVVTIAGKNYRHSSAAVRIMWQLGGLWKVLGGLLWLIPKPIRDLGYTLFAKNRYRFFGKLDACRLPKPEEQGRFLP